MLDDDSDDEAFNFESKNNFDQKHEENKQILSNDQHYKVLMEISHSFFHSLEEKNDFNHNTNWRSYSELEPIKIKINTTETLPGICDIIESKNLFVNKILIAFSSLIIELHNTIPNDYEAIYPLAMYDTKFKQGTFEEGNQEYQIGLMMPYLSDLYNKIKKLLAIAINMFNQLVSLYSIKNQFYKSTYSYFIFESMFNNIGRIFSFFIAIDSIMSSNGILIEHWKNYRNMFASVKENKPKYNITDEQAKRLDRLIRQIDACILEKNCFDQCYIIFSKQTGETSPSGSGFSSTINNKHFMDTFYDYLNTRFKRLNADIGSFTESNERIQLFHYFGIYGLYCKLTGEKSDKNLYQTLWSIQNKLTTIPIIGNIVFKIEGFMDKIKPWNTSLSLDPKNVTKKMLSKFPKFVETIPYFISQMRMQILTWITRMESDLFEVKSDTEKENTASLIAKVNLRVKTIINGIAIANRLKSHISYSLETHLNEGLPITKDHIIILTTGLELIKVIEHQFNKTMPMIAMNLNIMNRAILNPTREIMDKLRVKLETKIGKHSGNTEYYKDVIQVVELFNNNIQAAPSKMRMIIMSLCLEVFSNNKLILDINEISRLKFDFWKIETINQLSSEIKSACDCSFFFWYKDYLLTTCLESIFTSNPQRVYFFSQVLNDTERPLMHISYLDNPNELILENRKIVQKVFQEEFLKKIATDIEIDLRLEIHTMLISKLKTPDKSERNLTLFLTIQPFLLFDIIIDIKRFVEQYFNKIFYDMTTLNLNDSKTYQKMRSLAKSKYNIDLHDIFLPSQTLEQGRDLLELTRNISSFSKTHSHNLHSQEFIQKTNESNLVNVLGVKQILNSLYTHGPGIVNSIVNQFFRVLGQLSVQVIKFIMNEEVMSILKNEDIFWKKEKIKYNYLYPHEHAETALNNLISLDPKNSSAQIMELRNRITQIGNIVGLVRCIRSALMEYNTNNIKFLQTDYEYINNLVQHIVIDNEGLTDQISPNLLANTGNSFNSSNKMLADTISILKQTGENDINYLSLLVTTFDHAFSKQYNNLNIFSYLVPALSINFVSNLISSKLNLTKRNNKDAYFTDDGFIIGICYLIKIFDIDEGFDSLNWFTSILEKFKKDQNTYQETLKNKKQVENEFNKNMSSERTTDYNFEFEMLAYTFNSAMVLFNK